MGLLNTTTRLTAARNSVGMGRHHVLDKATDITYQILLTDDIAATVSAVKTHTAKVSVTVTDSSTAVNSIYGYNDAGAAWTSGNQVGVRGKTLITGSGNYVSATGVWAGLQFTTASGSGSGLTCALNAEVVSNTATVPNAIVYIQSLPGSSADFSDVPYLVFSETRGGGTSTGSRYLFEVGHDAAATIPTIGTGELFYRSTLQIAVNETSGNRTNFFIPLSTVEATFTTDQPVYVGTDGSPITITTADYQFSVHTTVDTASNGWFNAVVFDTETTSGAAITGNAQVVGIQCYARLNGGSWTASGGLTGISSVLVGTGSSTTTNGILQAMTAVLQLNSTWGTGGTGAEVAGLVIQNQADASASVHANHYHGIYIYCPNPAYLAFDNALSIQALSANGIYWEQTSTSNVFKWEERKAGIVGYGTGAPLNDINNTANQGYLKVLVEGQTRYIALYAAKS